MYTNLTLNRAIARDPTMFPDPEAFNPLRWVEPGYPTYQEPLTQFPTIINSTQFGYGRRTCQGQTVADEDMFIGIGSLAWLFTMEKTRDDHEEAQHMLDPLTADLDSEKLEHLSLGMNEKASISQEELNTGVDSPPTTPLVPLAPTKTKSTVVEEKPKKGKKDKLDPTLDYSILLIAKPLPFKFTLKVRDTERAEKVRRLFDEGRERGDYESPKEYWGEQYGKGKEFGWGKV